jgi:hypothetical protein
LAGTLVYALRTIRAHGSNRWIFPGILIVPFLAAIATSAPLPARTWLFALPFLLIMAAQGLADVLDGEWNTAKKVFGHSIQLVMALAFIVSLSNAWKSECLVSEPGGLVLVEPALDECQAFGASRCALISPYTPAMAYYNSRRNTPPLANPSSQDTQRVYILTSNDRGLDGLWRPGVDGYELYDRPQKLWELPGGKLYVAERAPRNVLR